MSNALKWGILGTGMIAKKFANDLKATDRGILAATGSRSQESADKFAAEFGGRGLPTYDALLADPEVEAIYISLPNGLHREWTIKALEAGKHVLCEKPIGRNATEAEEMFAAAEKTGQVLIEAFMYRLRPIVIKLIETVRSGRIGEPRLIRSNFTFSREVADNDARYEPDQAGGSIMDVGCYCVNLCRALAGSEPTAVHAVAHVHPRGVDDSAAGTLKFGETLLATFTSGMTVESDCKTYIAGTEGQIMVDTPWFAAESFTLKSGDKEEIIEAKQNLPLYAIEAEAFADVVQNGATPWMTKEDSLGNIRVLDELRRQIGLPVDFS